MNDKSIKIKNVIYLAVGFAGLVLTIIGNFLPGGIPQSIVINIASNLITTSVFSFFIIERLLQSQDDKSKKLMAQQEENSKKLLLQQEQIRRLKNQQEISVILIDRESNRKFKLPIELRRGEFTRGEILGRIGMLPMSIPGSRFSFDDLGNLRKINEVIANDDVNKLEIICNREEIEKFKKFEEYAID